MQFDLSLHFITDKKNKTVCLDNIWWCVTKTGGGFIAQDSDLYFGCYRVVWDPETPQQTSNNPFPNSDCNSELQMA